MPSDRLSRLRAHLACEGSRNIVERQGCFHQILRLFNEWPAGPDRDEAFAEARRELHRWSHIFRELYALAGECLVYDEAARSVRDTLGLVRSLRVRRYDDDDSAPPLSAILRSLHARELSMLHVSGTPISFEELARGPGAAQLGALVLNGAVAGDAPWEALERWPGLATLQFLQLAGASAESCSSERLWALLEHAPVFASLHVQPLDFDRFMDGVDAHPAVAHRLEQLSLRQCQLRDDHLPRLIAATALDRLATLDLRQNSQITCAGLAALRRAAHFRRGTILIDRDCP